MDWYERWSPFIRASQVALAMMLVYLAYRSTGIELAVLLFVAWLIFSLAILAHPTPALGVKLIIAPLVAAVLIGFGVTVVLPPVQN